MTVDRVCIVMKQKGGNTMAISRFSSLLIFMMIFTCVCGWGSENQSLAVGDRVEPLETFSVEGLPVSFHPSTGKILLVSFLTAEESASVEKLKDLIVLYHRFHEHGLEMVSVYRRSTEDQVFDLASIWQIPWPQVIDAHIEGTQPSQLFHVETIPYTIVLDSEGTVRAVNLAEESAHAMIAELLDLSLEDLPMPPDPQPSYFDRNVQTASALEPTETDVFTQLGYDHYSSPMNITWFEAVDTPKLSVLQKNASAEMSCGWYRGEKQFLLYESVTNGVPPKRSIREKKNSVFTSKPVSGRSPMVY